MQLIPEVLQVAIPLTIVYAVVRHSALNAGFVANRTLVYGLFLCGGLAVFASLDVLATKRFASNQLQVGLDVAIALAIGLSFQFVHPRAIRLVDRIFMPERYRAAVALDKLRATFGFRRSDDASPNGAIEAIAMELRLSSLAVFEKTSDGGLLRCAAAGWPKGTAWHIFAGDPLAQAFSGRGRIGPISEKHTQLLTFPPEPGYPAVGMSFSPQTAAESLILVGSHVNGSRPDYDEVRGIASLLRQFGRIGTAMDTAVSAAAAFRSLS
jgi:hypothetical protein